MNYLIQNGRVIDPGRTIDEVTDLLIENGMIKGFGKGLKAGSAEVVNAKGKIVAPGLVDIHVHFREPGREDKETIATGSRAAAKGGVTSVACMPNTDPAIDSPEMVRAVLKRASETSLVRLFVVGAMTRGREGESVTDIGGIKDARAVALSDDGCSVQDERIMELALREAERHGIPVIAHCEDKRISGKGVINEGFVATRLGLRGIPKAAEYEFVARDIGLARLTGARIHIAHVSCKESVEIIRKAKRSGLPVTAETAPHYFSLTEESCVTYDASMKMNPPLRTADDVAAIKKALADGTIDVIASDHAPHSPHDKDVEFDKAEFGIIGLETSLALSVTELVEKGVLDWTGLIARMSTNPARVLGIDAGSLEEGKSADVVLVDPKRQWTVERSSIVSKSKNSPFIGWSLTGAVTDVFVGGRRVIKERAFV